MNNKENILETKTLAFAIRIVKLYKFLITDHKEYVLSKQILRSGTSIGALIKESVYAQSKADFVNKLSVAIKETNETMYWLLLLKETDFIDSKSYLSIKSDCESILKILTSSIKTAKLNLKK